MKIVIVGCTGLVGNKILWLLQKRNFTYSEIVLIASENNYGKKQFVNNKSIKIITIDEFINNMDDVPTIIFFASLKEISKKYIPLILNKNNKAWIIDNSSEFRLKDDIPLVIPEVNGHILTSTNRLISNPNCSTAQLVMVLAPLHKKYKIKRVVISTYQSVSGAGNMGIIQLNNERVESMKMSTLYTKIDSPFCEKIDKNCIPFCDYLDSESGYTGEEIKLEKETPKILESDIKISATAVRVPVEGGHSESVNIEFFNEYDLGEVVSILKNTKGVILKEKACPRDVFLEEDVWVSRVRRDFSQENTLNLWIVADNLMKGASLNAVQIAETLVDKKYI